MKRKITLPIRAVSAHKNKISAFLSKIKGFSLIEMLMALLVASLLLAALAPVMTKRMNENINVTTQNAAGSGYKIFTPDDADCEEIEGENYMKCAFSVPNDVHQINVYMQGGGGGGAAAIAGINETCEFNTEQGNISINKDVCKTYSDLKTTIESGLSTKGNTVKHTVINALIVPGMQNLEGVIIGAGGGGGGGVYHSTPMHQNDCEYIQPGVLKYLTAAQNGGTAACVTKFAVADDEYGGPTGLVSGNTVVEAGAVCDSGACCYRHVSTSCDVDPSGGRTGCSRPVCTWEAANNACNNYAPGITSKGDWSLPEEPELAAWFNHLDEINSFKGQDGLQLCDFSTNINGTSKCAYSSEKCPGKHPDGTTDGGLKGPCHMQHIWSKTSAGTNAYLNWTLESLGLGTYLHNTTNKYTRKAARCLTKKAYTTYGGGGGGSGYIGKLQANDIINQLLADNTGNSIHIFTYGAFKGAAAANNGTADAEDGDSQNVRGYNTGIHMHYLTKNPSVILHVSSGHYGYGAKIDKSGAASGLYSSTKNCETSISGLLSGKHYSCKESLQGSAGATAGGSGGIANYTLLDGRSFSCFGEGGSASNNNENGKSMNCYGGGGGGGSATFSKNGSGSDGGRAYTEIKYQVKRKGASGGGGGGGASVAYRSIAVTPGETMYFYVGKGGEAGIISDAEGKNGGDSWFETTSTGKVIAGGGKGGKAGNNDNIIPVGGKGGEEGKYSNADKAALKKNGTAGEDGYYNTETLNSIGGNGGMSDNSETKTCGGLSKNDKCSNSAINGQSFIPVFETLIQTLLNKSKADAGQGGGGGAYTGNPENGTAGVGGKGVDGYIYIRWNTI